MTRFFAPAALVFLAVSPAFADTVTDTVLAFDRKANLIILADKTVFDVTGVDAAMTEMLVAGDTVTITYESRGDDGIGKIDSIVMAN